MNWTAQQYREHQEKQLNKLKPSKFKNEKKEVDGEKLDGIKESERYGILKLLEKKGEISDLKRQVPFEIIINGIKICKYFADFTYLSKTELVVEDVKSKHTRTLPVYRLKKKLVFAVHGIVIKEV